jgi:hypothetical protein
MVLLPLVISGRFLPPESIASTLMVPMARLGAFLDELENKPVEQWPGRVSAVVIALEDNP